MNVKDYFGLTGEILSIVSPLFCLVLFEVFCVDKGDKGPVTGRADELYVEVAVLLPVGNLVRWKVFLALGASHLMSPPFYGGILP